jgi:hypothetical protein
MLAVVPAVVPVSDVSLSLEPQPANPAVRANAAAIPSAGLVNLACWILMRVLLDEKINKGQIPTFPGILACHRQQHQCWLRKKW